MSYKAPTAFESFKGLGGTAIGCAAFVLLLPLFLALLIFKLVMMPFERPAHYSAEEMARDLREFADETEQIADFDYFISIWLVDPRLESIRDRAGAWLGGDEAIGAWRALAEEAEAIAAADREILSGLLRCALTEGVTGATIADALPYPRSLGARETKAYAALSRWADDDDIRAQNPAYAERTRDQLEQHLATLSILPHA